MAGIGDILRRMGIEITLNTKGVISGLGQIDKSISGTLGRLETVGKTLAAAVAFNRIKAAVESSIMFASALKDQSARLGISAEDLQKWSFVAEEAGASVESVTKAVSFFNRTIGEAQLGSKKATEALLHLGISSEQIKNTKNANDLLFVLADRLKALPNDAQRFAFAQKILGRGGKEVALVLGQGSEAIKEQIETLKNYGGILSNDAAKKADAFEDRMHLLTRAFSVLKSEIVIGLLPTLEKFLNKSFESIKAIREWDKQTGGMRIAIAGLTGALVVGGAAVFLSWSKNILIFGGLSILFAALYAIFEDIYYWLTGKGKSAIEEWLKASYGIEKTNILASTLRDIFKEISANIDNATKSLEDFANTVAGPAIAIAGGALTGAAAGAVGGPLGITGGALVGGVLGGAGALIGSVGNIRKKEDELVRSVQPRLPNFINPQNLPGERLQRNVNNTISPTIVINGATDPAEVGREVRRQMDSLLTVTHEDFLTVKP